MAIVGVSVTPYLYRYRKAMEMIETNSTEIGKACFTKPKLKTQKPHREQENRCYLPDSFSIAKNTMLPSQTPSPHDRGTQARTINNWSPYSLVHR